MKQLQNNFTTPEQSKRLLELGIPEWTCDCCYHAKCEDFINWVVKDPPQVMPAPFTKVRSGYKSWDNMPIVPCWSVGRLIEIIRICHEDTATLILQDCTTDYLTSAIVNQVNLKHFDFSKLED